MKKNIKYTLLVFSVFCVTAIVAQQLPRYSAYMFDRAIVNPAFTGTTPHIMSTVAYRQQFVGMEGNPTTQFFVLHAPIQKKNIGVGLKIVNDNIAVIKNTSFAGMFSYSLGLGSGKLAVGIEAGAISQSINFTNLVRHDLLDNAITFDVQSATAFDASYGFSYQTKKMFLGWTSFQILKTSFDYTNADRSVVSRLWSHNYFLLGYNFGSDNIRFEPSALIKHVSGVSAQLDFNFKTTYKSFAGVGFTYRHGESFVPMFELLIKESFKIGYAYDFTLSPLATYQTGTHEIMFSYRKKLLPPARDKETHPRFYIY